MRRLVTVAALAVCGTAATHVDAQEHWSYEIIPFVWAASLDGRVGVNGSSTDVNAKFKDLVEFANVGVSMRMIARRPPVDWFGEASYVELQDDVGTPQGTVRVKSAQTFGELGISYEFDSAFALYGGLRYQQLDTRLSLPSNQFKDTRDWVDGIAGVRWTPAVSDHWVPWVRADIGGGGSKLVWLAEAGVGYRWAERWGAYAAYRLLDTDYEQGGFLYDVRQEGLMVGFGVRF